MKVGRFIHTTLESHQLPTEWEHPSEGERHDGCQVLRLSRVLGIIERGEDVRDDWYRGGQSYDHVSIIEMSGKSGESGRSCDGSITEGDVETMYVGSVSRIEGYLTEIGCEMSMERDDVEVDEMGMPVEGWWCDLEGEVIDRLVEYMDEVEPEFVNTLD